jgi:hypothetical protein
MSNISNPFLDAAKASNVQALSAEDQQYQTGWWNKLTGGQIEKASAIGMAEVDRKYQANQARINREFQEKMSSTSYQRAMEDMKKAGLNPALMYSSMNPASTPAGSAGQGSRSTPPGAMTGQLAGLIASAVGSAVFAGKLLGTKTIATAELSSANKRIASMMANPSKAWSR